MLPASEGTGIIAGGALRPILELAGVKNVLSKRYGSTNILVNAQAAITALAGLRERPGATKAEEEVEKKVEGLDVVENAEADAGVREGVKVKEK